MIIAMVVGEGILEPADMELLQTAAGVDNQELLHQIVVGGGYPPGCCGG